MIGFSVALPRLPNGLLHLGDLSKATLNPIILDIYLPTVSSGKQDGLISKLEEKFSVLYTRSSYNKGRLIHVFFVQTAQNLGNYLNTRASNVNRFWIFLKKPTLVNIQIEN